MKNSIHLLSTTISALAAEFFNRPFRQFARDHPPTARVRENVARPGVVDGEVQLTAPHDVAVDPVGKQVMRLRREISSNDRRSPTNVASIGHILWLISTSQLAARNSAPSSSRLNAGSEAAQSNTFYASWLRPV